MSKKSRKKKSRREDRCEEETEGEGRKIKGGEDRRE